MNINKATNHLFDKLKADFLMLALAGSLLGFYGGAAAADKSGTDAADIIVAFKLDPRLTRSQYLEDRWLLASPYTSTLQVGQVIVEARARVRDSRGKSMDITPEWIPADPDMVMISPGNKGVVAIICKRSGQSRLQVVAQGVTREFHLNVLDKGNGMQVVISKL